MTGQMKLPVNELRVGVQSRVEEDKILIKKRKNQIGEGGDASPSSLPWSHAEGKADEKKKAVNKKKLIKATFGGLLIIEDEA